MLVIGGIIGFVIGVVVGMPLAITLARLIGSIPYVPAIPPVFAAPLWICVMVLVVPTLAFYVIAHLRVDPGPAPAAGAVTATDPGENLSRGALIGINAAVNIMVLGTILAVPTLGVPSITLSLFAIGVGVVGLLALVMSTNDSYATVLAWSSLAMPMSWFADLVGAVVLLINVVAAAAGRSIAFRFDWTRATLITDGSVIPRGKLTAWSAGNFSHVSPGFHHDAPWLDTRGTTPVMRASTALGVARHELGHTLNTAAFGSIFLAINAIHENIDLPLVNTPAAGSRAYAELAAESHRRSASAVHIPIWPAPVTVNTAPTNGTGDISGPGIRNARVDLSAFTTSPNPVTDPDDYPHALGVRWRMAVQPDGSRAVITPDTGTASALGSTDAAFIADRPGLYSVELWVTDGSAGACPVPAGVAVPAALGTLPPVFPATTNPLNMDIFGAAADSLDGAGVVVTERTVTISLAAGGTVGLTGINSSLGSLPPPLTRAWSITAGPAGASLTPSTPGIPTASTDISPVFTATAPGTYTVSLTVGAGGQTDTDELTIVVNT